MLSIAEHFFDQFQLRVHIHIPLAIAFLQNLCHRLLDRTVDPPCLPENTPAAKNQHNQNAQHKNDINFVQFAPEIVIGHCIRIIHIHLTGLLGKHHIGRIPNIALIYLVRILIDTRCLLRHTFFRAEHHLLILINDEEMASSLTIGIHLTQQCFHILLVQNHNHHIFHIAMVLISRPQGNTLVGSPIFSTKAVHLRTLIGAIGDFVKILPTICALRIMILIVIFQQSKTVAG